MKISDLTTTIMEASTSELITVVSLSLALGIVIGIGVSLFIYGVNEALGMLRKILK